MAKRFFPHFDATSTPKALVGVQVAHVRASASHSAELLCQVLNGWPVDVLERNDEGWYLVATHFPYKGWVEHKSLVLYSNKDWAELCTTHVPRILQYPEYAFGVNQTSNLVLGQMPHLGFYQNNEPSVLDMSPVHYLPASIVLEENNGQMNSAVAFPVPINQFMGIHYLWGGNSIHGMDCSGLVVQYYFLQGLLMPRNASQQAALGEDIPFDKKTANFFADFSAGDLLFFGEVEGKITHVAIYHEAGQYIHASGEVCSGVLDTDYALDSEDLYRLDTLQRVKRINPSSLPKVSSLFIL